MDTIKGHLLETLVETVDILSVVFLAPDERLIAAVRDIAIVLVVAAAPLRRCHCVDHVSWLGRCHL